MLRDLPEARHAPLPQAPVQLVVWQLQFAEPADASPPTVGTTFQERLGQDGGDPYKLQRVSGQAIAISFGPGVQGVPQAEPAQIDGWTLRRGPVVVTINPQSLSVETNAYETWAVFRAVVDLALRALGDALVLPGEQRLGLRYVDRVVHPGVRKLEDWSELLAPWLIGPLTHPQLRDAVAAYAHQVDFEGEANGVRATVRQRAFADAERRGRQTVILDYDVFREGYRLIEADATLSATDEMHEVAHRLFEASISESLYTAFTRETEGA
jgi:uncharacterized protein (TIGR04255 family)